MHMADSDSMHKSTELGAILGRSLLERWGVFSVQVERSRRRCTAGSVHDLRVAARRLVAVIDISLLLLDDAGLQKARRLLKKFLKAFSELRDVHVLLLTSQRLVSRFPLLKSYRTVLLLRSERLMKTAAKQIIALNTAALEQVMAAAEVGLLSLFKEPLLQAVGRSAVCGQMAAAFARVIELRSRVNPTDTRTIHRVRVAFKKFRYTVEVLVPVLEGASRSFLKSMNAYQVKLGALQDLEVLIASINTHTLRRSAPPESSLLLHQYLAHRRMELINEYIESAGALTSFWRAGWTSDRSLPG